MPPYGRIHALTRQGNNQPVSVNLSCDCGAEIKHVVEVTELGQPWSYHGPTGPVAGCTCPSCITCGWVLDDEGRCDNLDCPLVGTLILIPDNGDGDTPHNWGQG